MSSEQSLPLPPADGGPAQKWRGPLVILACCSLAFAVFWLFGHAKRRSRASRACFKAMFSRPQRLLQATEAFAEYLDLARDEVPDQVDRELDSLEDEDDYPITRSEGDPQFLEWTAFFCNASGHALRRARTFRGATIYALAYVTRNIQSGAAQDVERPMVVTPLHILCRGYGRSVEVAWVMAHLLRLNGLHACLIQLPELETQYERLCHAAGVFPPSSLHHFADSALPAVVAGEGDLYTIVGVVIEQKMYLFDPYRGVPLIRASDGAIADLQSLLKEKESLAPGFGGPRTPVTLEQLREAYFLVPADSGNLLADAYLLGKILHDNGRYELVYRSFGNDLANVAAAVFGPGATDVDRRVTRIRVEGRGEMVTLWDVPFKLDRLLFSTPGYRKRLVRAHRRVTAYLLPRQAQLFGDYEAAGEMYDEVIKRFAERADVVEDAAFFKASSTPSHALRAQRLTEYLGRYPTGRWRALATRLLAETEAVRGNFGVALELASQLAVPYDLYGAILARNIRAGRKRLGWRFPKLSVPAGQKAPQPSAAK